MTLDFAGRKVIDESLAGIDYEKYINDADKILSDKATILNSTTTQVTKPDLKVTKPIFIDEPTMSTKQKRELTSSSSGNPIKLRIQDHELQEMKDDGMCLSMHQPWASLLVRGIKM